MDRLFTFLTKLFTKSDERPNEDSKLASTLRSSSGFFVVAVVFIWFTVGRGRDLGRLCFLVVAAWFPFVLSIFISRFLFFFLFFL